MHGMYIQINKILHRSMFVFHPIDSVNGDVPLEQRLMTCLRAIAVMENEGPMGLHNRT